MAAVDVDTLQIQVVSDADRAVNPLNSLADALRNLAESAKPVSTRLGNIAKGIANVANAEFDAANKKITDTISKYKEVGKVAEKTAKKAGETKDAFDFKGTSKEIDNVAKSFNKMGMDYVGKFLKNISSEAVAADLEKQRESLDHIADAFAEKGQTAIADSLRSAASDPTGIQRSYEMQAQAAQQAAIVEKEAAAAEKEAAAQAKKAAKETAAAEKEKAKALQAAQKEAAKLAKEEEKLAKEEEKMAMQAYKTSASVNKTASAFGKLMRSLGRIAFYRAIRTAIKNVSAAIREGLTNLYTYSQEVGTAFAPAVDNLRQHVMLLKNAFATALRPVIEALIPVIIRFVDALAKAADFVAQVLSVLTGNVDANGRYTKAVLGDLQQSNKEAKELRRTLLGFDEINRLDGDTGSGQQQSASYQFVQADVSDSAKGVAEFLKGIDWDRVLSVLKLLGAALVALKGIKIAKGIKDAIKWIGTLAGKIGGLPLAIAAVTVAFGVWGDKISEEVDRMTKDTEGFFNGLKGSGSLAADAMAQLGSDISKMVGTVVSKLASLVYKLVHGDWKGALMDLIDIIAAILIGVVNIIEDVVNFILGVIADIYNTIAQVVTWIWNNVLQPFFNAIVIEWKQAFEVDLPNAWISIKQGILTAVKWILENINKLLLKPLQDDINGAISAWNDIFGTEIKPVKLTIDTSGLDAKIAELEETKLPDIDQSIDFVAKWSEPEPWQPKLDLSGWTESIQYYADLAKDEVKKMGDSITRAVQSIKDLKSNDTRTNYTYASGGFPAAGSMFIAGEAGAEWVGDIGGRTGVMNTDQMAAAMYEAMNAALRNNPSGGDIYLDGEVIYQNTVRYNNNNVRATGRSALLV